VAGLRIVRLDPAAADDVSTVLVAVLVLIVLLLGGREGLLVLRGGFCWWPIGALRAVSARCRQRPALSAV